MKVLRISDELHAKVKYLAEEDRRTINAMAEILLERAIGSGTPTETTPTPKKYEIGDVYDPMHPPEKNIAGATPLVADLFTTPTATVEDMAAADAEKMCCKNETQPCRHWVWDSSTGEGYKNVLSGRFLEVD